MIWVEQPIGTGFSQGTPTATNQAQTAADFLGFFKRFVDTFNLHNKKIFITGESYAGKYVPYIADAMFNKNDKTYYDVESILIYDPSTSTGEVQNQSMCFLVYTRAYLILTMGSPCRPVRRLPP